MDRENGWNALDAKEFGMDISLRRSACALPDHSHSDCLLYAILAHFLSRADAVLASMQKS